MTIPLKPVTSSQIDAIGYSEESQTLAIRFKPRADGSSSLYYYSRVTKEDWLAFATAESLGSHFYKVFKHNPQKYPYRKIQ